MSESLMLDPGVGYVIVIAFALLFAHAALGKWRSRTEFGAVLANYRVVPAPLAGPLAVALPALETAIALLLLAASTRAGAAATGALLLLSYGGAIAINLRRGRRDIDCGCAGPADRRSIAAWMVWRNGVLAVTLAAAALPWSSRPFAWTDAITIGGGLVVVSLLYRALDRLLAQVMPRTAALRGAR